MEEDVFPLLDHFRYIVPAGSPMTGIGNHYQVASLSNCFVIGLDGDADSYGAVMLMDEEQVQLMKITSALISYSARRTVYLLSAMHSTLATMRL